MQPSMRSGPEFANPTRGEYVVKSVPLDGQVLPDLDIKPPALTMFLATVMTSAFHSDRQFFDKNKSRLCLLVSR